ncbi:pyridoxamine 5'-phosphate oxidase family protein [Tenacibaculum sp. MEBiC06402]|uniref:pyridoxamine 5'-phosphate oxidase family protein n=1 Tax=unclassified Tenacibaculum TaxID=2635139 RepID=UPI003B99DA73
MKEFEKTKLNRIKRGANRAVYDKETINEILDAGFIAQVGYIYDGYPISIPMAYARKGNKIYLHGSTANRMLKAVLEIGKTSINVMHLDGLVIARSGLHHSVNYRSATLFGELKEITDDNEKTIILKDIVDHMIPNHWDTLRPMHQKELDRTMVVEFIVTSASAKIRAEGVNDEPEDYELPYWAGVIPVKQKLEAPIPDAGYPSTIDIPEHLKSHYNKHK